MLKVEDRETGRGVYVKLSHVDAVSSPGNDDAWWQVDTSGDRFFVDANDAMAVVRALNEENFGILSSTELQAAWEQAEARLTRIGAEMRRRVHGPTWTEEGIK